MNPIKLCAVTIVAGATLAPATASAATLLFTLSGGRNATFQLDSNPTPTSGQTFLGSEQAAFTNLPGTVNGAPATIETVSFGTGIFATLSVVAPGLGFTQFGGGGPLFTGTGAQPVFAPGTFKLTNFFFPDQNSTLVISAVAAGVPEPSAWALLILGFGVVGAAMRRRTTLAYA